MSRRLFYRLLGIFLLLLAFQAVLTEAIRYSIFRGKPDGVVHLLERDAIVFCLMILVALPLLTRFSSRIGQRLQSILGFSSRMAKGDLAARLKVDGPDEFSPVVTALNSSAVRLQQDFAELERGRSELAVLLDSMQEAVVAITADGSVSWSNSVMERLAGTQVREGRPLVHSVRDPDILACAEGALRDREVRYGRAYSLLPGSIFEINAAPMPGGGAVVVLHDVTNVEAAEKSRRDFIANVSHELRTPLTSISGYLETLLEDPAPRPETTREFLSIILKNSNRMNRLTEDLLELASVESPDYKIVRQPIRASALVEDAIESLAGLVVDSGVLLESGGAPDDMVLADPDAMTQVFGNLIENALKYGKSGGRIRVYAQAASNAGENPIEWRGEVECNEVEFIVQDFGSGIAFEHLNRIFERFYRIDKARSRDSGGTGLGLAIVKHIVQAHGGRIWAVSELGSGAAFHFTLPALARESAAANPAQAEPARRLVDGAETPANSNSMIF